MRSTGVDLGEADQCERTGACKGLGASIFYPDDDDEADDAKHICAGCGVRVACLEHALATREKVGGVWGGATGASVVASSASAGEPPDRARLAQLVIRWRAATRACEHHGMTTLADFGGWPALIGRLVAGGDLSAAEAEAGLAEILSGGATPAQIAAFVVALRAKGETADELAGLLGAVLAARTGHLGGRCRGGRSTSSVRAAIEATR